MTHIGREVPMPLPVHKQRLSQTTLWDQQARAYKSLGIDAWTQRGVPSYLSSNPFIAKRYAQIAFGYVVEAVAAKRIQRAHPVFLFELGAGTGRFSYLFLKYFLHLIGESPFKDLTIRYVMTDLSQELIANWKKHPYFQRLVQSGILDFAQLDLSRPSAFRLQNSNETIKAGFCRNSSVVIANYLFGYLASDLFAVRKGALVEGLVTLNTKGVTSAKAPQVEDLQCKTRYRKLPANAYYPDKHWNDALHATASELPDTPFTLPIGAYCALDFFRSVSKEGYCFLAADRGAVTPQQIVDLQGVSVSRNALCAVAINCRALVHYFKQRGEMACTTRQPHPTFVVMVAAAGSSIENGAMTQRAFSNYISDFEPADYWELVNQLERRDEPAQLEEIALLLKLGDWDSTNFHAFYDLIRGQLKAAPASAKKRWSEIVDGVFDNFFPISAHEANLIVNMGVLHFELGNTAKALLYFQQAYSLGGEPARIFFNIGLCHKALGDPRAAEICLTKAGDLDAQFAPQGKKGRARRSQAPK